MEMQLKDEKDIQIFVTMKKIRNIDNTILSLINNDSNDDFTIKQWEEMKNKLTHDLFLLLAESGIQIPAAA